MNCVIHHQSDTKLGSGSSLSEDKKIGIKLESNQCVKLELLDYASCDLTPRVVISKYDVMKAKELLSPQVSTESDMLMKVEVSSVGGLGMNSDALYEVKTEVQPDVEKLKLDEMTGYDQHGMYSQSCGDIQGDVSVDYDGSTDCEGGGQEEVACRTVKPMMISCRYCRSSYAKVYYIQSHLKRCRFKPYVYVWYYEVKKGIIQTMIKFIFTIISIISWDRMPL